MSRGTRSRREHLVRGGGEMGKVVRAKDWSPTPLGPIESWPQSLLTTVSLCLSSNFPISIAWGRERTQIYNDGYWPICGAKHPTAMGQDFRECWASAWPAIGDAFEAATAGETRFLTNERMFLDRHGYLEETFFTFSFSPIRDETGEVGGLFHPVTELTQQSLGDRRLKVLRSLADETADAKSVEDALHRLATILARADLDVPFFLVYRVEGDEARLAASSGVQAGAAHAPLAVPLDVEHAAGWPLGRVVAAGSAETLTDLSVRFRDLRCGPYPEPPHTAVVVPIWVPGVTAPFAVLIAGVSSRRALDEAYETFFAMLGGAVTNALTGARSYEEERARADALAQLDRAKTAFFSNVSHEFRTPLTLMLGPIEDALGAQDEALGPRTAERLQIAHRNSLRLLKLVNTLLDFSRIEAGRIQAAYEETDVCAYTEELVSVFRSATERAGLTLEVACEPIPEPVYLDREMWEKVILNLLSNAFKFTLGGGIHVSVRPREGAAVVSVRDTGTGIPAEELPNVFERFHRVKGARGRTHEGTGIGLALVQELVKLHGGSVSVESEVGRGTTFTVTLPTGHEHLPRDRVHGERTLSSTALGAAPYVEEALRWLPGEEAGPRSAGGLATGRMHVSAAGARVLVADDNQDMREYLRRILSAYWRVETSDDGEAALASLRASAPDLVLADVMMPRLDGFGLLRAIREDAATRTLPVILLSARAGEEARVEGLDAGADDYLTKPFSARELVARVNAHLELARARKEAEAALRESEERYRHLVDLLPVAVYTCAAPSGLITFYNEQAASLWGRAPRVGDTDERFCGSLELRRPDGTLLPHDQTPMARALQEGHSCRAEEVVIVRPDGSRITVLVNIDPVRNAGGEVIGAVNAFQDVTPLKQAESAVAASEARFRSLVSIITDVPWSTDAEGAFVVPQEAWSAFTGQTWEELRGFGWSEAIHPGDRDEVSRLWNEAVRTGSLYESSGRLWNASRGEYRFFVARGTPLRGTDGTIREWVGTCTDVSAARAAEEKLREADQRKDEFLAMLAHELRNPLAPIQNASRLMGLLGAHEPRLVQAREIIERQTRHLARLVDDLLDVSRITRGKIVLQREPLALDGIVRSAVEVVRPAVDRLGHRLGVRHEGEAVRLEGDFARLVQVVSNLLANAVKFTPPGGEIVVATQQTGDVAVVRVRDTGVGIEPELQTRIFDLFVQEESGLARTQGGLGIGLTLVKRIVELHGGTVVVESEGAGRGSEFVVTLPALPLSSFHAAPTPSEASLGEESATLPILVVEDNPDTAETLRLLLELRGHDVHTVLDGYAALAAVESFSPAIGFIDVGLPGIDGYELAARLREHPRCSESVLVALTGYGREEDKQRAIRSGFDHHLTKPVDFTSIDRLLADVGRAAGKTERAGAPPP